MVVERQMQVFFSSDGSETGTGDLMLFLSARPGAFIVHYPAGAIELSFDRFPSWSNVD